MTTQIELGGVGSLWRYPVKSMMGEELNAAEVTDRGLRGDRGYALVDRADGKVATAKNPRKWPHLFDFRANLIERAVAGSQAAFIRVTLPDGTMITSVQDSCDQILSRALAREVTLESVARGEEQDTSSATRTANAEEYWPDMEGLDFRDTVTDFALPAVRRFRPNIVVLPASGETGFIENSWVGHTLAIGDEVRLSITGPCGRCVMTTLAQGDLPKDPGILRTAAQHNRVQVGVYAAVVRGGTIRRGDSVRRAA